MKRIVEEAKAVQRAIALDCTCFRCFTHHFVETFFWSIASQCCAHTHTHKTAQNWVIFTQSNIPHYSTLAARLTIRVTLSKLSCAKLSRGTVFAWPWDYVKPVWWCPSPEHHHILRIFGRFNSCCAGCLESLEKPCLIYSNLISIQHNPTDRV